MTFYHLLYIGKNTFSSYMLIIDTVFRQNTKGVKKSTSYVIQDFWKELWNPDTIFVQNFPHLYNNSSAHQTECSAVAECLKNLCK